MTGENGSAAHTIIASVATPLILMSAAYLYFSGTVYHSYVYQLFGLPSNAQQLSLQETMVEGYKATVQAFMLPVGLGILAGTAAIRFRKHVTAFTASRPVLRYNLRFARLLILFFFVMLSGWGNGFIAATQTYSAIRRVTQDHCRKCYYYVTTRGQMVGLPLGQDDKSITLISRVGVHIIPTGSIKSVRRLNPIAPMPQWFSMSTIG